MCSRNFAIALLISLGIHIFLMSGVIIIAPEGAGRIRPCTRVDFLGPILRKTAFDIMIENINPVIKTTYRQTMLRPEDDVLGVAAPERRLPVQDFSRYLEDSMDTAVVDFLKGSKIVPDLSLDPGMNSMIVTDRERANAKKRTARKVIYSPEPPSVIRGPYGDKETVGIRVKVAVSSKGTVRSAEPLTTTGYPQLDIMAAKFVKSWIFEPREDISEEDEWLEVDVVLNIGE